MHNQIDPTEVTDAQDLRYALLDSAISLDRLRAEMVERQQQVEKS